MRRSPAGDVRRSPGGSNAPQITRVLELGCTAFSAAEVRVAVAPVGEVEPSVLQRYYELITKHKQVELQSINPYYREQQKSPFKHFPWKQGSMHFRFLPEDSALRPTPLNCLHTHRNVLGVIGICHCPHNPDLDEAYAKFETLARQFPGAMLLRCFAFQPSDTQWAAENQNKTKKANLMIFPPTEGDEVDQLESLAKFYMLDFATILLGEIERWMLTASPNMIDLSSFADTSEKFLGPNTLLSDMRGRFPAAQDEEMTRKKRYGRMQKAMGDFSLLAGSPTDAVEHYTTAIELARNSSDHIWLAASYVGMANAKTMEHCLEIGEDQGPTQGDNSTLHTLSPNKKKARLRAASQVSAASGSLGGHDFWEALKRSSLESEAKAFYNDAKNALISKRGGPALQVEIDLQLARLLAGLHGSRARREVSERASSIQEAGLQLFLPEDRLYAMMEAAQILGLVGSGRKRILILWQAVEASRAVGIASDETLQIARKALEPPDDPREAEEESELLARQRPLRSSVPQHWSRVRAACIEGVLSTAIMASRHADVWDAAALLLREHWRDLSTARQEQLVVTLQAASSKMQPHQFKREGSGPPPLISFKRAISPPSHLLPRLISVSKQNANPSTETKSPFLYNPLEAKDKQINETVSEKQIALWVSGETATVEIEIWNPTSQTIQVERVTLDAVHSGDPSIAPKDQNKSPPAWKPFAFTISMPPNAPPSKVQLTGIPFKKGLYTVTGCTVVWNNISWQQPWTTLPSKLPFPSGQKGSSETGGLAKERVKVAEPLPLLNGTVQIQNGSRSLQEENTVSDELDKPPLPLSIAALKGQILNLNLMIKNIGKLNVTHARVLTDQQAIRAESVELNQRNFEVKPPQTDANIRPSRSNKLHILQIQYADSHLKNQLPIKNGSQFSLPVLIHNPEVIDFESDEDTLLDFRIEYYNVKGGQDSQEEFQGAEQIGRCLLFPLKVKLSPSLQITRVKMYEHHEAPGKSLQSSDHKFTFARRRCVLELSLQNKANALQVWLGSKHLPNLDSSYWKTVTNHPRPWQKGGAPEDGQPQAIACRIISSQSTLKVAAFADKFSLDLSASGLPIQTPESQLAKALSDSLALYWRREEDLNDKSAAIDMGCMSIPSDLIERSLDEDIQHLLRPAKVQARFKLAPPKIGTPNGVSGPFSLYSEELLLNPDDEGKDDFARPGALWGYRTQVGQPMQLQLEISNELTKRVELTSSIACHSTEIGPDSHRGLEDANVLAGGLTSKFTLNSYPNKPANHGFMLCFLLPGLYQLYLHGSSVRELDELPHKDENQISKSGEEPQIDISVRATYIFVEE